MSQRGLNERLNPNKSAYAVHVPCTDVESVGWPPAQINSRLDQYAIAGIPWDRHGHRHRHGHPRRLPRDDRPRAGHARGSSPTCPTRGVIFLASILARMSVRDARVYTFTKLHDRRIPNVGVGIRVGVGPMEFQLMPALRSWSRDLLLCRTQCVSC